MPNDVSSGSTKGIRKECSEAESGTLQEFIDPVLLQDEETERVFLISDAMAAGYGSPQAVTGSGYKEIQGKKYLKLQKAGETDYNYTVRENGVIYNDTTNQPTEYSLNSNFEILKDNVLQTVKQKSSRFDPTNGT